MNGKDFDSRTANVLAARGVTWEQQETKMNNLSRISRGGIKIRALAHDQYLVEGKEGYYDPYTDAFSGSAEWNS